MLGLPILVFFLHTVPRTAAERLAPGQRRPSERAPDVLRPTQTLHVLDDYHVATAYYADRPTLLITPDPGAHAILMAAPGPRLWGTVKFVRAAELPAFLRAARVRALQVERHLLPVLGPTLPAALGLTEHETVRDYTLFWFMGS